jgi:predicted DNA-binding protein (MmcQ/YjbR family)
MNIESLRRYCLSLPHATEHVQWGNNLVFKVGGKIFVIASLDEDDRPRLSFKSDPETMAELLERPGCSPAPYLARAYWVAIDDFGALSDRELRQHLQAAYQMVLKALPKKTRVALEQASG